MTSKTEHGEQVAFVRWFRAEFPSILLFAIPNGGKRDKGTAVKLREEGVLPGVPDLFIPAWRMFVEMKVADGGRLSAYQVEVIEYLRVCGYKVEVCHGWREARQKVLDHLASCVDYRHSGV